MLEWFFDVSYDTKTKEMSAEISALPSLDKSVC